MNPNDRFLALDQIDLFANTGPRTPFQRQHIGKPTVSHRFGGTDQAVDPPTSVADNCTSPNTQMISIHLQYDKLHPGSCRLNMVISYLQFVSPILRLVDLETLATSLDILLITSWFLYTKAMGNRRSGGFPIFILQYQLLVQSTSLTGEATSSFGCYKLTFHHVFLATRIKILWSNDQVW